MIDGKTTSPSIRHTIAVLGAGNIGTALAHSLVGNGHDIALWDYFPEVVEDIRQNRSNCRFLPGILLHENIRPCASPVECVAGASLIVLCMPSAFVGSTLTPLISVLETGAILLNVAKGFAPDGYELIPSFLNRLAPEHSCVQLAGPMIANELMRGVTAYITLAGGNSAAATQVAAMFSGSMFVPTTTDDVAGAALGGILKNVYAILLGCAETLSGSAHNLEAAAVTACLDEMVKIAGASGGRASTIYGLAGLGDLVATGFSHDSHNRKFGQMLAVGKTSKAIKQKTGWLPEGARAAAIVGKLAREKRVAAPLVEWVATIIEGTAPSLENLALALRTSHFSEDLPS